MSYVFIDCSTLKLICVRHCLVFEAQRAFITGFVSNRSESDHQTTVMPYCTALPHVI